MSRRDLILINFTANQWLCRRGKTLQCADAVGILAQVVARVGVVSESAPSTPNPVVPISVFFGVRGFRKGCHSKPKGNGDGA